MMGEEEGTVRHRQDTSPLWGGRRGGVSQASWGCGPELADEVPLVQCANTRGPQRAGVQDAFEAGGTPRELLS